MGADLGAGANGARIASLIGAVGGVPFVVINAPSGAAGLALRILGIALFVATVVLTGRADRLGDGSARTPEQMRAYWWIVLAEVVAIPVGATLLTRLGVEDAGLPRVSIVLGVHFVGFPKVFPGGGFALLVGSLRGVWLGRRAAATS